MKVLLLNTSDTEGGAARAAYRLHQGLQGIGVSSQMLVKNKNSGEPNVISSQNGITNKFDKIISTVSNLPLRLYPEKDPVIFSTEWLPDSLPGQVAKIQPDIINLHWVCGGYLQVESIPKFKKPIVWTLHDMWPFTGGCHYSEDCDRYTQSCGSCPQLHSVKAGDMSRWVWQRKAKAWKDFELTLVTPSKWLAKCVEASSLFRDRQVVVIPNGLDTQKFKPINRQFAREILNLPQDKQLLLFGAMQGTGDRWKGFSLLQAAMQELTKSGLRDEIELVVFGPSASSQQSDLGFKIHYLGRLNDDITLAMVYSAVDVMVVPSLYESFGQTASESLACGTPVVAFNATGLKDIVDHMENGYLAKPYETEDLARGIAWVLENPERHQKLCRNAREKVEAKFTLEVQAREYQKLYEEVLYTAK
ncbi:glycosyltransferase family 4 protein [Microcoleus sp.]|uniref:glycosyltransferase family 4 protein n=1 Tax=Microcoleus sp. TaxID=44472 RepID=UPI0035937829